MYKVKAVFLIFLIVHILMGCASTGNTAKETVEEYGIVSPYFARIIRNGKWGIIDLHGNEVIPALYDKIIFDENRAPLKGNGKIGFIDENCTMVIPAIYDDCTYFSHNSTAVKHNGLWGYIDRDGNVIVPITLNYDKHGEFSEGLIAVMKDKKWGYIDAEKNIVIPLNLNYDEVYGFSNGMARVRKKDKYGYIDGTGTEIIKIQYLSASDFQNNVAIAAKKKINWAEFSRRIGVGMNAYVVASAQASCEHRTTPPQNLICQVPKCKCITTKFIGKKMQKHKRSLMT